ncbi:MAG: glycosyl transferase [Bacteroidetes bacterium]|nr:glycosyl transferase [Bacteroidota bacterium]
MKILYGIQGTGNGHISRAIEIIPHLQKWGDVDILISGQHCEIDLPYEVKYRFKGLGFIFGTNGGIDFMSTYLKNKIRRFYKEIKNLPVEKYDIVITDFEPVTAWACFFKNKPCIGLSNQISVLAENAPQPKKVDPIGKFVLKNYCPITDGYGFHFKRYNKNIYTPILRKEVRNLKITDEGFYLVYLPAYEEEKIIKSLSKYPDVKWKVFSKHSKRTFTEKNVEINPINKELFMESLASCTGVLCNAGFAATSEALYLKKKLMVIPMKNQFEQQCNAEALGEMGVPVLKSLKFKHHEKMEKWISESTIIDVDFPDETEKLIDTIIEKHVVSKMIKELTAETVFSKSLYPVF